MTASTDGVIRIGDVVPDFKAQTTKGDMHFYRWMKGKWVMLFSHPLAFTPVCTTEIGELAKVYTTLRAKGWDIVGLSCDNVKDQLVWQDDIRAHFSNEITIDFPIIGDENREIAVKYGMLDPALKSTAGEPVTNRTVFFIGPDKTLKLSLRYPANIGRDTAELLRICDALLLSARENVATPASWPDNHASLFVDGKSMEGAVFLLPRVSERAARSRFPVHIDLRMPSGRKYMRLAKVSDANMPIVQRLSSCYDACGLSSITACLPLPCLRKISLEEHAPSTYSPPGFVRILTLNRGRFASDQPKPRLSSNAQPMSTDGVLRIGDAAPDFAAETTKGKLNFHTWIEGKWTLLCTHPKAFTPVCTTEVGTLAIMNSEMRSRGFRVASMSCDTLQDLMTWQKDILAHFDNSIKLDFPMIADPDRKIAQQWGLIDPECTASTVKNVATMREVFVIGPDKKVKLTMNYPDVVGRNIHELLRVCDALQLSQRENVVIPANWPNNHEHISANGTSMMGACFVPSTISEEDAMKYFPSSVELPMPSHERYMRLTRIDMTGKMPLCKNCIAVGGKLE